LIVVSDCSPLVTLALVDKLWLLDKLFSTVLIPQKVYEEATVKGKPCAEKISAWAQGKISTASNSQLIRAENITLDPGESEAITLYKDKDADFLLIDERQGRKVAESLKLRIIGSLGILVAAKKRALIDSVSISIDILRQTNQRFSDEVYNTALRQAGESR
jgi:predicted nucleic acid-binding protein